VRYRGEAGIEEAVDAHRDWILGETLAVELNRLTSDGSGEELREAPIEDRAFAYAIEQVSHTQ